MATVRYIVNDVEQAVDFYTGLLGFEVHLGPGPGFAMLRRADLRLALNEPGGPGGASRSMPDGRAPRPGGWSRFQLEVDDLAGTVARLRDAGVEFRGDIVEGRGGRQVLIDDPSGNAVELFEPKTD